MKYHTRLTAAGSMLPELTALLEQAPEGSDRAAFRKLVIEDNLFARPNLRSREKIWEALITRYLLDSALLPFRVFVRHYRGESSPSQRALLAYLLFSITDPLFFDLNRHWLTEQLQYPGLQVTAADLEKFFESQQRTHPEIRTWSASTRTNILRHISPLFATSVSWTGNEGKPSSAQWWVRQWPSLCASMSFPRVSSHGVCSNQTC